MREQLLITETVLLLWTFLRKILWIRYLSPRNLYLFSDRFFLSSTTETELYISYSPAAIFIYFFELFLFPVSFNFELSHPLNCQLVLQKRNKFRRFFEIQREAKKSFSTQPFDQRSSPGVMQTRPSALLFEGFPRDDLPAVMGRERIQRLVHVSFIRRRRLRAKSRVHAPDVALLVTFQIPEVTVLLPTQTARTFIFLRWAI